MIKLEKGIRTINGEEKEVNILAGLGNLTNDIETRIINTQKGEIAVAGGKGQSIAFDYWEKGEKKPTYYQIEAWGKIAEALEKVGKKGAEISVIGRVEKRSFVSKTNGQEYTNNVLIVENFQITSRSRREDEKTSEDLSSVPEGFEPISEGDEVEETIPF